MVLYLLYQSTVPYSCPQQNLGLRCPQSPCQVRQDPTVRQSHRSYVITTSYHCATKPVYLLTCTLIRLCYYFTWQLKQREAGFNPQAALIHLEITMRWLEGGQSGLTWFVKMSCDDTERKILAFCFDVQNSRDKIAHFCIQARITGNSANVARHDMTFYSRKIKKKKKTTYG